jgi:hypothetical protein
MMASTEVAASPRLLGDELSVGLGVLGAGSTHQGGRWGEVTLNRVVEGRLLLGGFTIEAAGYFALPLSSAGAAPSSTALLRLGWSGRRYAVTAGALLQHAPIAQPALQTLPSLRAELWFSEFGTSLGIFDHQGLAPAHVSLELRDFSLGYVAPIGAVLGARVRLRKYVALRFSALAFRLFSADVALFTVSVAAGPRSGTGCVAGWTP